MQPSTDIVHQHADRQTWTYASLVVLDGQRALKPSDVSSDRLLFPQPPHLTSTQIEIILTNGDAEQRHIAEVLPHDPQANQAHSDPIARNEVKAVAYRKSTLAQREKP